jgi:2,3-dimethylmalate lyase
MGDAARVRSMLAAGGTVHMPGVFDALSARLAARAGFPVVFVSGFAVSAARLGLPDIGYLTPAETADVVREVRAAVTVPVIADADTGYGNALSAAHTARRLHAAGAAGIFLEDQVWPKRCGHMAGKEVVPRAEWLAKLRAVADLRHEGIDLFLVARTDAGPRSRWRRRSAGPGTPSRPVRTPCSSRPRRVSTSWAR